MKQIFNCFNYINDYKNGTSKYSINTGNQISLDNCLNSTDYNDDHRGQNENIVDKHDYTEHRWLSTINNQQFMANKFTKQMPAPVTGNKRQRKKLKQRKYDRRSAKNVDISHSKNEAKQFSFNNTNQRRITNIYQRDYQFFSFRLLFIICFCCQITSTSFFR